MTHNSASIKLVSVETAAVKLACPSYNRLCTDWHNKWGCEAVTSNNTKVVELQAYTDRLTNLNRTVRSAFNHLLTVTPYTHTSVYFLLRSSPNQA